MTASCDECGQRFAPEGRAGRDGVVACARCDRLVHDETGETLESPPPLMALGLLAPPVLAPALLAPPAIAPSPTPPQSMPMGQPPKTGPFFGRVTRGAFPDKPQRVSLPQVGRTFGGASSARLAALADAPDPTLEATADGIGVTVDRQTVAEALALLDEPLGADWTGLLAADELPALLVRLTRARRLMPGPAVDDAVARVVAWQRRRVDELLGEFEGRIVAGDLDAADALLGRVRGVADVPERIERATAALARAWKDRQETEEGRLKLDRARELAAPPHPPRRLKRALKLYDDLLRRLDRYVGLRPAYDLIKSERDEVDALIRAGDRQESERATAIALREIDGLVATRRDYIEALESGKLEEDYARSRIEQVERTIGEALAGKVEEYLQDAAEIAENPRDAQVALDRVREHAHLWVHLAPAVRARVERQAQALAAVVKRREDVLARCDAAAAWVEQGDYVGAIGALCLQQELHAGLQVDVQRPLAVAVRALEQRVERRLVPLRAMLGEPHLSVGDLERLIAAAEAVVTELAPVAALVEVLGEVAERAAGIEREARRLRGEIEQCDREIERLRGLIDRGEVSRAVALLGRIDRLAPAQRRGVLADLKEDLDLVVRDDEIESRLDLLAVTDLAQAAAWAEAHPGNAACRRYVGHARSAGLLDEIRRAEASGAAEEALVLAGRLAGQAPPALAAHVEAVQRRIERAIADRAEVLRRLDQLREARRLGRLGEARALFEGDVVVAADLAAEWAALADEAARVDEAERVAAVEAAVAQARASREAAQAAAGLWDDPLAPVGAGQAGSGLAGGQVGTGQAGGGPLAAGAAGRGSAGSGQTAALAAARVHLDDALRALESAAAATLPDRRARSVAAEAALAALAVEQRLCGVEERIARRDFEEASALLEAAGDDARFERARARLRRVAFGRRFGHAMVNGDRARAEALIEGYGAAASDEVQLASRVVGVAAFIEAQLGAAADGAAGGMAGAASAGGMAGAGAISSMTAADTPVRGVRRGSSGAPAGATLDRGVGASALLGDSLDDIAPSGIDAAGLGALVEAHRRHAQLVAEHPQAAPLLAPVRARLDDAIVRRVEVRFEALLRDPLPGGVVEGHRLLAGLIDEHTIRDPRLVRRRVAIERDRVRIGRETLEQLEGQGAPEQLTTRQFIEIERRLDHLAAFVPDDDPQWLRCRKKLATLRTTRTRQRDANRRRDELVRRARESLDAAALDAACAMEIDGQVDGDEARRLLETWRRAEPIVAALGEAMAERAFDRVAPLLDALERSGSAAHVARVVLPDPFDHTRALPAGVARLREVLPRLAERAREVVAAQAREIEALDALLSGFDDAITRVAADAPAGLEADPGYAAFVEGAVRWAAAQIDVLSRRVDAVRMGADGASSGARRLSGRLPPMDAASLTAALDARFRRYRADHRFVMARCQDSLPALRRERAALQAIRDRWAPLPELVRLVDELLR